MSLRDRIADVDDLIERDYEVPEWSVKLKLRSPTLRRRHEYLAWRNEVERDGSPDALERMWAGAIVTVAVDPDTGEHAFTWDDVPLLAGKNAAVTEALAFACVEVMGLTPEVTDLGKDSSTGDPNSDTS